MVSWDSPTWAGWSRVCPSHLAIPQSCLTNWLCWREGNTSRTGAYAKLQRRVLVNVAGTHGELDANSDEPIECSMAHYFNALKAYSSGELSSALSHITKCANEVIGLLECNWARAFKE